MNISLRLLEVVIMPEKVELRSYSCDDCFISWDSEDEELICSVCGSSNIYEE
jgi:hypothetical protein